MLGLASCIFGPIFIRPHGRSGLLLPGSAVLGRAQFWVAPSTRHLAPTRRPCATRILRTPSPATSPVVATLATPLTPRVLYASCGLFAFSRGARASSSVCFRPPAPQPHARWSRPPRAPWATSDDCEITIRSPRRCGYSPHDIHGARVAAQLSHRALGREAGRRRHLATACAPRHRAGRSARGIDHVLARCAAHVAHRVGVAGSGLLDRLGLGRHRADGIAQPLVVRREATRGLEAGDSLAQPALLRTRRADGQSHVAVVLCVDTGRLVQLG